MPRSAAVTSLLVQTFWYNKYIYKEVKILNIENYRFENWRSRTGAVRTYKIDDASGSTTPFRNKYDRTTGPGTGILH